MRVDNVNVAPSLALEDEVALTSGASFWRTCAAPGVPSVTMTDGPHGVRAQEGKGDHLGIGASEPATCFPPAAGLAQSWDVDLVRNVGEALGVEARGRSVQVLLGPGLNIRRDPRCGRNFEYPSEDPHLTGALGVAWVEGVQSQGVGTSPKHFAVNNAETDRMRSSSDVDPRALREIYLRAFERVVRQASPWTIMASYNRINGVHASESRRLLTEILRDEWGFDGLVVSDWGAVTDRVASLRAGLDLAMPGPSPDGDREVLDAVNDGRLSEEILNQAARRVCRLLKRAASQESGGATLCPGPMETIEINEVHHELAREAASRSIVLLRNESDLLPLAPAGRVAVLGHFAVEPRFQGGGSSHIRATRVDIPLEEIRRSAPGAEVVYAPAFPASDTRDHETVVALREEAVDLAAGADVAIIFLGLPEIEESEGFDREHIELPREQIEMLQAVSSRQPKTVVVLSHGGVVALGEVTESARAILDGALLGQGGGAAIARVLFGEVNPSGRLTETVPQRLEDVPSYLTFPGEHSHVLYGESIHVGYRWYDARHMEVAYPFGHGLSYTQFAYDGLEVEATERGLRVTVTVTNTGSRDGREIAQFYIGVPDSHVQRAPRELRAFAAVTLRAGESSMVEVLIDRAELAYWDRRVDGWIVEGGTYDVFVGASSRDLRVSGTVVVEGDPLQLPLTLDSTMEEVAADPKARELLAALMPARSSDVSAQALGMDVERMSASMPLRQALGFAGVAPQAAETLLNELNA